MYMKSLLNAWDYILIHVIVIIQMKPSLGIFDDDTEDITEGIFKSAYTELGDADAGTRSE